MGQGLCHRREVIDCHKYERIRHEDRHMYLSSCKHVIRTGVFNNEFNVNDQEALTYISTLIPGLRYIRNAPWFPFDDQAAVVALPEYQHLAAFVGHYPHLASIKVWGCNSLPLLYPSKRLIKPDERISKHLHITLHPTNNEYLTLLHVSVLEAIRPLVAYLLTRGTDVDITSSSLKETPLHTLVRLCETICPKSNDIRPRWKRIRDMLDLLLQFGADINIRNVHHHTPLMTLCNHYDIGLLDHYQFSNLVKILLDRGASPHVLDQNNKSLMERFFLARPERQDMMASLEQLIGLDSWSVTNHRFIHPRNKSIVETLLMIRGIVGHPLHYMPIELMTMIFEFTCLPITDPRLATASEQCHDTIDTQDDDEDYY